LDKIAVIDTRLSNTASMANYWLAPWPGSEAALLLAMANVILQEERYNREFLRSWVNWEETLRALQPEAECTFDTFLEALKAHYAAYTPAYAERETGVAAALIVQIAHEIAAAGTAFAAHVWRSAASGNEGGWQVARCLEFLSVLTGSIGTRGGTSPNTWDKFVASPFKRPAPQNVWSELLYPKEYPLAFHEMSFLLPHFLKSGWGRVDTYFTRVYNPVWTNPDGATWIEVLRDEILIGLHAALTPVWSETAWFADYVLPMGTAAERHNLMSQETQAGSWIGFRQPVLRVVREKLGQPVRCTYEANPGEVWEEDEFWIELSWRIDPDGSLGVRQHFESPYHQGAKLTIDEYYQWIFENSVPGLPEAAAAQGLTPLDVHFTSPLPVDGCLGARVSSPLRKQARRLRSQGKVWMIGGVFTKQTSSWRLFCAAAAVLSLIATTTLAIYKIQDLANKVAKAQAANARLEALETFLETTDISIEKATDQYTQILQDVSFVPTQAI
jgi:anaerobic selenocysteine-containing dehydrogenase